MRRNAPVSLTIFWGSVAATAVCSSVVLWTILGNVSDDAVGKLPRILIILLLGIFITASLATTEIFPWHSRRFREWQRPKVLGSVVLLLLGSVAFIAGVAAVFAPPNATEATASKTLKTVAQVQEHLIEAGITRGKNSLVEQHIDGLWGEPGCQVTYAVVLNNGLLTIASDNSVKGQNPFRIELETEPGRADRLVASVVMPLDERGDQHEFTYQVVGAREFLSWVIKKREVSLKLDRCT